MNKLNKSTRCPGHSIVGLGVAAALGLLLHAGAASAGEGELVAEITAPADGFKLRPGQIMPVAVRVQEGRRPLKVWSLELIGGAAAERLAGGDHPVAGEVAGVAAERLERGRSYWLRLRAEEDGGAGSTHEVRFLVPDPQYVLIPLEAGNMTARASSGLSMNSTGRFTAFGGAGVEDISIYDAAAGTLRGVQLPIQGTEDWRLSGDGRKIAFGGSFRGPVGSVLAIYDLETGAITHGPRTTSPFLSVDHRGERVAFNVSLETTRQHAVYDFSTGELRQLTNEEIGVDSRNCPAPSRGITPMISGDGNTVAFAIDSTLGLVPDDSGVGCRIFAYDVPGATFRHVAALPLSASFNNPAISSDGRWLSFISRRRVPPNNARRPLGALLDLSTGELDASVGGVVDFPVFDAVVSGDGSAVVMSTTADLDPRVGNADGNMELFVWNRAGREFAQVTDTRLGIGRFPNNCFPYQPRVSADGSVVAFGFNRVSVELCQLDGVQRDEATGFAFRRVRAVRTRPGNRGPVLERVSDVTVMHGDSVTIELAARDPDGDAVVLFLQVVGGDDIPPGADAVDHYDGTAVFRWTPAAEQRGVHHLRAGAFDQGGGYALRDFTITVRGCAGDCDGDGKVTVDELIAAVSIALGQAEAESCAAADADLDGTISVSDLVAGARAVLEGCGS
jgi:hypothetical protein